MNSFVEFLQHRFSPCVYIFASEEAKKAFPDYKSLIRCAFEAAIENNGIKFRIIFPDELYKEDILFESMKKLKRTTATFPDPTQKRYEFSTISSLRKKLIKYDFLSYHNFCDIPVGTLAVMSGQELPAIPIASFPKWARGFIQDTKANIIKLPANDPIASMTKWVQIVLNKKYENIVATTQANYAKSWSDLKQTFLSLLDQYTGIQTKLIELKYYADIKLQQKQYKEASNAYSLLISNTKSDLLAAESQFMLSICDILRGTPGGQTLQSLSTSMQQSRSYLHIAKCSLVDFYVRATIGANPIVSLNPLVGVSSSKICKFVAPFAKEQIAHLLQKPRHSAQIFAQTAVDFSGLELTNYATNDLIAALTPLKNEKWDFLVQSIMMQINDQNSIPEDLKNILSSCQTVIYPCVFENVLKGGRYKCGFISAKPCSFYSEGFMCAEPLEYEGEWVETAERLFGAYKSGTFFNASFLEHKECLVGEQVDIRTLLMSDCGEIQISKLRLKLSGDAEADLTLATISRTTMADVNLSFTPTKGGILKVEGVEFCWGSTHVDFYVDFKKPLVFTVYDDAPKMKIEVLDKKMTFVEGEICQFTFKLTNGQKPLTHVLFFTTGLPVKLIEPEIEEVCQMYPVGQMNSNEEKFFRISIYAKNFGFYHTHLLISYWNKDEGPARYLHHDLMCNVTKKADLQIKRTDSYITIRPPPGSSSIGFTHPYSNPDPFTQISKLKNDTIGDVTTFRLVSEDTNHKTVLPDFVIPFFFNDTMRYWYSTKFGYCSVPLQQFVHPLRVLVSRVSFGNYRLTLKNAGKDPINDVKIIVIEQESPVSYILSGKSIVVVDKLLPNTDVYVDLNFVLFEKKVVANLLISYELFCISEKIVIE
ncbi:hypothetical protein TVAG_161830 [Trichomonas vaginalis G3]|uniref:Uncharacterized protein n=1 Tax=Trichomonas vaginalis (strain ATCC PRA-98 / G3) TaxID=412133 RepID=A2EUQ6_TRIV3|nr:hypothetical protein TVAGG3_0255930 [Trichomonas vaginalis G3]EAY03644.1 hypothetical protein TVAG_161830 [Trichomonas vaginalis G3]KAI5524738.1 hypothetical protein TVAGG3_0255930 [Trichomonas vaginalis G3]|eukprot:XP_001315867.1 hypothetical protein [Trichomonas vaginalis G3]